MQRGLQKGRKHCGKRRNCSLRAISPFPTVISKDLYCRHVKTMACLGKPINLCQLHTFVSVNVKMKVCKDQLLNKSLIIHIHVLNSSYAGHPPWP